MIARLDGEHIVLPGIATVHSHAFQRALRGRTQRRATGAGSFWSWRGLMFALVERLDPDSIYVVSRFAFVELALSGVTTVGEFHYLHHDAGGTPYADRCATAHAVIAAARDAGLRIVMLRSIYARAGFGRAMERGQERFIDSDVDVALGDVETLRKHYAGAEDVSVGLAPHSLRAVPRSWLVPIRDYARAHAMPVHVHVSEQRREVQECVAEYGVRPIGLFHELEMLDERFVAVHATHLEAEEVALLARGKSSVALCRTTERDLGDGHAPASRLAAAGVRISLGTDSHASSDPFEEARAVELDARVLAERRHVAFDATALLAAATTNGYVALRAGDSARDEVRLRRDDAALCGFATDTLDDAVIYAASPRAVDRVTVGGRAIVDGGVHSKLEEARSAYERTMAKLIG